MSDKNPHQIIGTFCDKCRNVMCTCKYKENKAPNKIYVDVITSNNLTSTSNQEIYKKEFIYILESEHLRIVEELKKHLQILLAAMDGELDAKRIEYGELYPESVHSIKAKEYLKSIK